MPIRPYLNGHTFDPETIQCMSLAFIGVCADLHLRDKNDRMSEVVAKRIIELAAKGGYRDSEQLRAAVIESFKRGE